jgi:hypothetical protein
LTTVISSENSPIKLLIKPGDWLGGKKTTYPGKVLFFSSLMKTTVPVCTAWKVQRRYGIGNKEWQGRSFTDSLESRHSRWNTRPGNNQIKHLWNGID